MAETSRRGLKKFLSRGHDHEPEVWSPYRLDGSYEDTDIEPENGVKIFQRIWWDGAQMTDWLIVVKIRWRSKDREVARADCRHGEAHWHQNHRSGTETRKVLRKIETPQDLFRAYDDAYSIIARDWDGCLRRWERGR